MPTNVFFNHAVQTEQHLYEDLVVESLRMYGNETYYLPREIIEEDTILGEDVQSRFGDAYSVEMYLENTEGYEGEGDLMSKFGIQVRDQATFVLSLRTWHDHCDLTPDPITRYKLERDSNHEKKRHERGCRIRNRNTNQRIQIHCERQDRGGKFYPPPIRTQTHEI